MFLRGEVPQAQGCIKLPDREPSRLAAGDNGLWCWTFWRLFALVAAASRDGSRSEAKFDADLPQAALARKRIDTSQAYPAENGQHEAASTISDH